MRAFHAVARAGSFSAAARELGVTQPAVTVQVKGLEEAIDRVLFVRGGGGAELTPDGARLLEPVRRIMRILEDVQQEMAATRALRRGVLRVGISTPSRIMALLARFSRLYPGIDLTLESGNTSELVRALEANRVDVIVASQRAPAPRLFNLSLGRQEVVLVAGRGHALTGRPWVEPAELAGAGIVLREEGSVTRAVFEEAMAATGVACRVVASLGSREMVKEAAASGLGLGIVFEGEVGEDARLSVIRLRGAGDLGAEVYLTCQADVAALGSIGALVALAQEEIPDRDAV